MSISKDARRDIIDYLLSRDQSFHGRLDLITFLKRIWDLSSMASTDYRFNNAEDDIWKHMVMNDDWSDSELLYDNRLGLLDGDDAIFLKFVEQIIHPLVIADDEERRVIAEEFNSFLEPEGYILASNKKFGTRLLYSAVHADSQVSSRKTAYEVVLSYAGEDRNYVEKVAAFLKANKVHIFYDKYEEATLWGVDLAEHLDKVYGGTARYCVMFISKYYAQKVWTNHERQSALAKAIHEKTEYILPARFDDTKIPGIRPTIGYVDLASKSAEDLGRLVLEKLGRLPKA